MLVILTPGDWETEDKTFRIGDVLNPYYRQQSYLNCQSLKPVEQKSHFLQSTYVIIIVDAKMYDKTNDMTLLINGHMTKLLYVFTILWVNNVL